jgi:hypothetical protein
MDVAPERDDDARVFLHGSTTSAASSSPTPTSPAFGSGSPESSERAETTAGAGRDAARASPRLGRGRARAVPTRGTADAAARTPIAL